MKAEESTTNIQTKVGTQESPSNANKREKDKGGAYTDDTRAKPSLAQTL